MDTTEPSVCGWCDQHGSLRMVATEPRVNGWTRLMVVGDERDRMHESAASATTTSLRMDATR